MTTDSSNPTIPSSQNQVWGFFGSLNEDAQAAWPMAMKAISGAAGESLESVRLFLDSRHGRHFADDVRNEIHDGSPLQQAIDAAVARWMGWRIYRHITREYGIPRKLPYLTGFVIHCAIVDELAA